MQLKKKAPWQDLKSVYGLMVLGDRADPWHDTAACLRHYKVLDHLDPKNVIDCIQMIEVNINHYASAVPLPVRQYATEKETHEWMTFFKTAPSCDEDAMKLFTLPEIHQAFRAITTTALTLEEKTILLDEQSRIWGITHANQKHHKDGVIIGKKRGIVKGEKCGIKSAKNAVRKAVRKAKPFRWHN